MYLLMVVLMMGVFPVASVAAEYALLHGHADLVLLVGKWFVFWAVGIRLLAAGIKQVFDPAYTATVIFRIEDPEAYKIIAELGFGNLAVGAFGAITLLNEAWITPAAIIGAIFFGLAGVRHVLNADRTFNQNVALVSDLAMLVILTAYLVARLIDSGAMFPSS